MDPSKISEDCDYIELHIINSNHANVFDTKLSKDKFYKLLQLIRNHNYKYSQVDNKVFTHYFLKKIQKIENDQISETKVFQQKLLDSHSPKSNLLALYYDNKKISSVLFPSSNCYHNLVYQRKIAFRIHHRIYINFVIEKNNNNDETIYKVYLNINLTKNIDLDQMNKEVNNILKIINL